MRDDDTRVEQQLVLVVAAAVAVAAASVERWVCRSTESDGTARDRYI